MNGLREIAKIRPLQKWVAAPFSKLLLIREESGEVFNIRKMLLFHTNPTVYHTYRSDKRLKSSTLYQIRRRKTECARFLCLDFSQIRSELDKVFYIWMERLIDIFPTVYHLHHSDERFKRNREKTAAVKVCRRTIFETPLNP